MDVMPCLNAFYGPANQEISELHGQNNLNLKSYVDASNASVANGDNNQQNCTTSLHCSRPETTVASGPCDIFGVVGAVCSHTIPLEKTFIDMFTPEQFMFYIVMLKLLIGGAGVPIRDIYIDFACRFGITWKRYVSNHQGQLPPGCSQVRLLVNWMHGSSHSLACQLVNNARYITGTGRKVGENSEQLWSLHEGWRLQGWLERTLIKIEKCVSLHVIPECEISELNVIQLHSKGMLGTGRIMLLRRHQQCYGKLLAGIKDSAMMR